MTPDRKCICCPLPNHLRPLPPSRRTGTTHPNTALSSRTRHCLPAHDYPSSQLPLLHFRPRSPTRLESPNAERVLAPRAPPITTTSFVHSDPGSFFQAASRVKDEAELRSRSHCPSVAVAIISLSSPLSSTALAILEHRAWSKRFKTSGSRRCSPVIAPCLLQTFQMVLLRRIL